jgi:hypothetical protein
VKICYSHDEITIAIYRAMRRLKAVKRLHQLVFTPIAPTHNQFLPAPAPQSGSDHANQKAHGKSVTSALFQCPKAK